MPALLHIENACFSHDRLTRRQFRHLLEHGHADLMVACGTASVDGHAAVLYRRGTALARIYSLAVAPLARGAGQHHGTTVVSSTRLSRPADGCALLRERHPGAAHGEAARASAAALAARRAALRADPGSVRSPDKRLVMALVDADMRAQFEECALPVQHTAQPLYALEQLLGAGSIPIVLISQYRMYHERTPHWVVVCGHDQHMVYVNDPWVDREAGWTEMENTALPLPKREFERMARYGRSGQGWSLESVRLEAPGALRDLDAAAFTTATAHYFSVRWRRPGHARPALRMEMAVLRNAAERFAPSNPRALARLVRAWRDMHVGVEFIGRRDIARLPAFDALFIRETTSVSDHTYRFASRAASLGLVVMDDPVSIHRCCNKIYLAELFAKHGVATPDSVV